MKRIDIIGAPGVGKTTLMKKMTWRKNRHDCICRQEALKRACKLTRINRFDALSIRYYFQINKKEASRRFVKAYPDTDYYNSLQAENLELIKIKAVKMFEDEKYSLKERLHSYNNYQSLLKELFILHKTNPAGTVVYDESISHLASLQGLTSLLDYTSSSYLYPKGVIFLDCPSDLIFNRLKKRDKLNSRHENLNDQGLREDTRKLAEETRQKSKHLEQHGIPVLKVNAADDLNTIYLQVTDWLNRQNFSKGIPPSPSAAV